MLGVAMVASIVFAVRRRGGRAADRPPRSSHLSGRGLDRLCRFVLVVGFGVWFVRPRAPTRARCREPVDRGAAAGGQGGRRSQAELRRALDRVDELVPRSDRARRRARRRRVPRTCADSRRHVVHVRRDRAARARERGVPLPAQHLDRPDLGDAPLPLLRAPAVHAARVRARRRARCSSLPRASRASFRSRPRSSLPRRRSCTRSRSSNRYATSASSAAICSRFATRAAPWGRTRRSSCCRARPASSSSGRRRPCAVGATCPSR